MFDFMENPKENWMTRGSRTSGKHHISGRLEAIKTSAEFAKLLEALPENLHFIGEKRMEAFI